jgi:putative peptidoglycan lipid II flippase
MLRRFFAEGALTSAFVPTFSEYYVRKGEAEARELANICFTMLTIVTAGVALLGIILSPYIIPLVFYGWHDKPKEVLNLTIFLNQLMFPYIFFISLVALCMGILNTLRHFFTPAVSTVFLNLSMIGCAILLRGYFAVPVTALAIGVLIGGLLQLVLQIPVLYRKGFPIRFRFVPGHPALKRIALLMTPSIFGVGVYYINTLVVGSLLASFLPQGSVSYLYFASRLFEFPQGIITVSVAQALLTSLSRQAAAGDMDGLKDSLNFGIRVTLFITIPASLGLMICAKPIYSLLFTGGAFDIDKANKTAEALFYYSFGLSFVALVRVLVPAFYSLKDTRTPVLAALVAFILNAGFSLLLMGPLLHGGLALAGSISALGNMTLLAWFLRRKIGPFGARSIVVSGVKFLFASLPMAVPVYWGMQLIDWTRPGEKFLKCGVLIGSIAAGIAVFFICVHLLRCKEAQWTLDVFRRRLAK